METFADKNNDVLAREEYMERFDKFQLYWIEVNGVKFHNNGDWSFVSDDGESFSHLREYDGEAFENWFEDEIIPDDVSFMQYAWKSHDLEAVLNGGRHPSDYITVSSLDFMYEGEV